MNKPTYKEFVEGIELNLKISGEGFVCVSSSGSVCRADNKMIGRACAKASSLKEEDGSPNWHEIDEILINVFITKDKSP